MSILTAARLSTPTFPNTVVPSLRRASPALTRETVKKTMWPCKTQSLCLQFPVALTAQPPKNAPEVSITSPWTFSRAHLAHIESPPHHRLPPTRRSITYKSTKRRLKHCRARCRNGLMCGSLLSPPKWQNSSRYRQTGITEMPAERALLTTRGRSLSNKDYRGRCAPGWGQA